MTQSSRSLGTHLKLRIQIGKLQITDRDIDDVVKLSIKGPFPNLFTVSNGGEIRILIL
ncbi:uncharacterized protein LOC143230382 [Tachypleus tridentatus]|uniref:uncharacterized protein LOC143230382 n=1 Tax=Tachypleus tridentatus TaxID=6853 RepID=UPI003FCF2F58